MTDQTATHALPGSRDIFVRDLPNGITVYVRENFAAESVVMAGYLEAGSVFDPPAQSGLADFVASALMRGTQRRTFDQLYETLDGLAARLGFSSGINTLSFSGKCLAEDLPTLLEIAADVLMHPAFPDDQTERLRGESLTGLKVAAQNSRLVASENATRFLYPAGHPNSFSLAEETETVRTLRLDDLRAFHARHYGARAMKLVIVGAVKGEDAVRFVEDALGAWANPDQPALPLIPRAEPIVAIQERVTALPGKTQTDVVMAWVGPERAAPDYTAASLANNILGVFGMMGRIGKVIREREGFAYYANSRLGASHVQTPWVVTTGVAPQNVRAAVSLMQAEVARFCDEPIRVEELADSQANYTGRLPLALEGNEGVATMILTMLSHNLGLDYLYGYAERVNAITPEEVSAAARHYLNPNAYVLGIAGA
ncbi:MAG: insulinase family protein [Anaerolineales bacterium]|nr:insulinase family protein [Anaerolineales bacterium]